MCIIITKEKSAKPLPEKIFENIWDNNPNGGGILYFDGKKTTLKKGIMKKEEFLKEAKKVNKKGIAYIMHTRIATHGTVIPENTHPFVSKTLGFAHNGMFNITPLPEKTDSESFFLWTIADKTFKWCEDNKLLLDMATDGCRCAIMDLKTGEIMHLCDEDWKTNKMYSGYKFSNETYQEARKYYGSQTYLTPSRYDWERNTYKGYNDYSGYDDLDDWEEYNKYINDKKKEEPEERFNTKNVTLTGIERDKNNNLKFSKEWVEAYLQTYATKTKEETKDKDELDKKRTLILQALRQMRDEVKDCIKWNGEKESTTQASMLVKSFTHFAFLAGYYDVRQVMETLKNMITDLETTTKEEEELVTELELTRREYM